MKQEFEMTQEEMDNIIAINKGGGDPVMFLSGGTPMGSSLQEKINQYWEILGNKYGFKPMTAEGSSKGHLFFLAEATLPQPPKTQEMKKKILNVITDLCSNFLYYDRKEDSELTVEQLNEAVENGVITIDEIVAEFRKHIENTFISE